MPQTTTAIRIERHGPPEVLVERTVPLSDPGPGEVHVRVRAVGVNFGALAMRAGLYGTVPPIPYSPGFEIAGEVVRLGPDVEGWKSGDRCLALLRFGGYARDVVVAANQLFRYPESLTPAEAAAVPVAFLTAWVALFNAAHAEPDETVLVLGAGGGVGTAAVQLAVQRSMRVIGTAGTERKRTFVTDELGASACFDSRGAWEPHVRAFVGDTGVDVALDAVGGPATASCRRLLAPLGRLVFYGLSDGMPRPRRNRLRAALAWLRTPRFHPLSLVAPNIGIYGIHLLHLGHKAQRVLGPALDTIFADIAAGRLRPVLDTVFPLTGTGAAQSHRYLHERRNIGKVVLTDEASMP
jgi:NADPH:quinone reductase-like Zn-dependent oxidoreductase